MTQSDASLPRVYLIEGEADMAAWWSALAPYVKGSKDRQTNDTRVLVVLVLFFLLSSAKIVYKAIYYYYYCYYYYCYYYLHEVQ